MFIPGEPVLANIWVLNVEHAARKRLCFPSPPRRTVILNVLDEPLHNARTRVIGDGAQPQCSPCKKKNGTLFFECIPYVCPEPVLVK
jgi:hypothetical protein